MKFILGTKDGMTQVFDADGVCYPATVLKVPKNIVTQIKTVDNDGYEAVQVAAGEQKEHRVTKAEKGHLGGAYNTIREFRARVSHDEKLDGYEKGQELKASVFTEGDTVIISSVSKGKGFQGVVKRHGFHGGPGSHGQKHCYKSIYKK